MDYLCGNVSFWDLNVTWHTDAPKFTPCFEDTLLTFIPVVWIILGTFTAHLTTRKSHFVINVTFFIIVKTLLTVVLVGLFSFYLGYSLRWDYGGNGAYRVDRFAAGGKLLSYVLALYLIWFFKYKGIPSAGLLFIFWVLTAVCDVFSFQRLVRDVPDFKNQKGNDKENIKFIVSMVNFAIVLCMMLLNCWSDVWPKKQTQGDDVKHPSPEATSSFLSQLVFYWFEGLAIKGFRKPLEESDLWDLNEDDKSKTEVPKFEKIWNEAVQKGKIKEAALNAKARRSSTTNDGEDDAPEETKKVIVNVLPTLFKVYGKTFCFGGLLKLIQDTLTFVSPQILSLLIAFVEDDVETWKGYLYAGLLLVTAIVQTLVLAQYFHRMFTIIMKMRTTLTSAIYRKALRISNSARKESTVGEIVNLMSVDVQRLGDLITYLHMLWSSPFQIALSLYFLWNTLGPSVLAGLAVMVLLIPVNAVIANKMKDLQTNQMESKDKRVKLMSEILSGIKVLKLYAWEPSFEAEAMNIRNQEMSFLRKAAYMTAGTSFVWSCAPFLVSLITFATYVLVDENNVLDAKKAFVSLTLFNIMRMPLAFLPMMIVRTVEASVSLRRLNRYLNAEEIDDTSVTHDNESSEPIVVEDGNFSWEEETETLTNVNLKIPEGSLVAVVGTVGSGKSSLLSAILGDLIKTSGRVNTKGSIAYVAQQAWIQNCSLKDNVLFGKEFNKSKYDNIIGACALQPDLDILPAGDKTEIGEKGVNLSGGQKQRVSLARAAYNDADIYLFDDPLSAVDSHVGKHIFEKMLGPQGMLSGKTRVLVTHGITYLPQVDNIIVMKDGQISEAGSYSELLKRKGAFADFLMHHMGNESDETLMSDDYKEVIKELEDTIGAGNAVFARRMSKVSLPESETGKRSRTYSSMSQESTKSSQGQIEKKMSSGNIPPTVDGEKLIEAEKSETGSVKFSVYVHYLRSVGWLLTMWTFTFYVAQQGFAVGSNYWLSVWTNEETDVQGEQTKYLGVYAALGLGQALCVMLSAIIFAIGMLAAASAMHTHMLKNILRSPMSFFDTTPLGRIVNRFSKDVDVVDNTLPMNLRQMIDCIFQVAATVVVISYSTPLFLSVIFPLGIIYFFIQRFYVATSRQLKRLESVTRSPIYSHFGETLTGSSTIRAYSMQQRFILESERIVDRNQVCYFPSIVANRWLSVRLETIGTLIIFFAALFAVLQKDTLSPGLVGLSVSYSLQITQELNWVVRMSSEVETNVVAVERMKEYGETPKEAEWELPNNRTSPDWPNAGVVVFEKYQTRYREGLDLVLRDVTCVIESKEKIGIVGRTGAGKSSLTLALFRIVEATGGSITIDGQDISKLGLHDVRGRITIIPQDPVLFSGTLRLNLDPFVKYSDEQIWRTLELAHLKPFVQGLSAGLSHEINEGGENLSVGQRQLVCLARALLRKTKILVLDEATAAVDLETDDLIQQTIRKEFADCTVLTIAHRLNTIMDSTRVVVLDKGEIREFDSPKNLLAKHDSIFYGMAKDAGLV